MTHSPLVRLCQALCMLATAALLGACGSVIDPLHMTLRWREEVRLSDGRVITVDRTLMEHRDWLYRWAPAGVTDPQRATLTADIAPLGRLRWTWKRDDIQTLTSDYPPLIFDVVNGVPWIVQPVSGFQLCEKYGFPREGLLFYKHGESGWVRQDLTSAPASLVVNLLLSSHELRWSSRGTDQVVTIAEKKGLARDDKGLMGRNIQSLIDAGKESEVSCYRMSPPFDPDKAPSLQAFQEKERTARRIDGRLVDSSSPSRSFAQNIAEFHALMGRSTEVGSVFGCDGIVRRMEPARVWKRTGSMISSGYYEYRIEIVTPAGTTKSLYLPATPKWQMRRVTCADQKITALLRSSNSITLVQYDLTGLLERIWVIAIPDMGGHVVIGFRDHGSYFEVALADVSLYGPTIERQYIVRATKS